MKKSLALIMCLLLLTVFTACGKQQGGGEKKPSQTIEIDVDPVSATESADEYSAYRDIFYDGKADDYADKSFSKTGTFAVLYDDFNDVERYYVWGYDEKTKEDWQWELKLDGKDIPKVGSKVEVSGKLENDDAALDKYWLTDPKLTVKEEYEGVKCDIDMSVMSPTLTRVQMSNIQNYKDKNDGKTVAVFASIVSENLIGHPYSEESWQMHFSTEDTVPKAGTLVIICGTFTNGILENAKIAEVSGK